MRLKRQKRHKKKKKKNKIIKRVTVPFKSSGFQPLQALNVQAFGKEMHTTGKVRMYVLNVDAHSRGARDEIKQITQHASYHFMHIF